MKLTEELLKALEILCKDSTNPTETTAAQQQHTVLIGSDSTIINATAINPKGDGNRY